jgi:phosphoglycerate kinase
MKIADFNFAGKKAIVRVDFNVPLDENGNVTDDTRIRGALPTLKKVLADGGALIMMSHMGKPFIYIKDIKKCHRQRTYNK